MLAKDKGLRETFTKPIHIVLGASMLSEKSELFEMLLLLQNNGVIGKIMQKELKDDGDNAYGVGGINRREAYRNAINLVLGRHGVPSFLNTHPESGHIHRRRSQSTQKAVDYIRIIFINNKLAGDYYADRALSLISSIAL